MYLETSIRQRSPDGSNLVYIPPVNTLDDFDWNSDDHIDTDIQDALPGLLTPSQIEDTEILMEMRDALQGIRRRPYPDPEDILSYIDVISRMGIQRVKAGIYVGDNEIGRITEEVLRGMYRYNMKITPCIASLARPDSVEWAIRMKEAHPGLQVYSFIDLSIKRKRIEEWDQREAFEMLFRSVDTLYREGIPVVGVAENASIAPPEYLRGMIEGTVGSGANRVCIPDTTAQLLPASTYRLIKYVKQVLSETGNNHIGIELHTHDDLGLAVPNAMAGISAGVTSVHATATGTGERAGNASDAAILLQLYKHAQILKKRNQKVRFPYEMEYLLESYEKWHRMLNITPRHHGPGGSNAFRTNAGVHASPVLKEVVRANDASAAGDYDQAEFHRQRGESIYTAFPPELIGGKMKFDVNYMSSGATVRMKWTTMTGLDPRAMPAHLVDQVLEILKNENRPLTKDEEVLFFSSENAEPFIN